jgi:hypothetical protein
VSKNTQLTNLAANTEANSLATLCNNGYLNIYDGTQPATADTAITTQNLLVTLRFSATAFPSASAGVLTANTITSGTAGATGTAAWFRVLESDNSTVVFDGSVGTATANLILPTTSISSGQTVSCSSFTHTVQKSTSGL